MSEDLPSWARRIRSMREARGWSQTAAANEMRKHTEDSLPATEHLARRWKDWELGKSKPSAFYAPVIAATLGTVTSALFPPEVKHETGLELVSATGMDTLEIVSRLHASDVNDTTLEAVRITVDKLCSEYARQPPLELITEGRQWLRRLVEMQEQRLTFRQRRQSLEMAGWLALLVGCLEYDLGDRRAAEATRQSALSLGKEVESGGIMGWAHEMQAWFALTSGDYRGVIAAGQAGEAASGNHSVSVQLIAQQAKAYARMGMRDEMLRTLERGRVTLDQMPYPTNVENHFVVDPSKYDFYAMDCYRHTGEDKLARELSDEVIRVSTGFNNHERWPMRVAEAQVTLGVIAARQGDVEEAVERGRRAITGDRKSLPSLAMVSQDLATVLHERYAGLPEVDEYLTQLRNLRRPA
ncbi:MULTISPECIES: helix-turn-helix domain-containing protein [Amycolatopsis]|uniref:helix-turn-helix domain-containing protein n=1 Tax=Amycolatopsis TaxID=1813 RepID=UPI000B8AD658|nr:MULTISPECIES: helix-turn-helix transcriptional regulator [Amycolatopsis]OXM62580.1 hypothetical protein CF166_32625 [Amycolatopsis sp. KNN50.9b]